MRISALISEALAEFGKRLSIGDYHPSLAGGDLFIGIKRKSAYVTDRAYMAISPKSSECLAGIFNN